MVFGKLPYIEGMKGISHLGIASLRPALHLK
jgi:hypothetical protein